MSEIELPPEQKAKIERIHSVQREVAGRLIIGGLIFGLLVLGAAYLSVVPGGKLRPAAVQPLLESYLEAGKSRSLWGAHRLYSKRGLREVNRQAVFVDLEERGFFEPFSEIVIVDFDAFESRAGDPDISHEARLGASILYENGSIGRIDAQLDLEENIWRIRDISLSRP
jgi:hypothetical protein